jgi:hypothetical protein
VVGRFGEVGKHARALEESDAVPVAFLQQLSVFPGDASPPNNSEYRKISHMRSLDVLELATKSTPTQS